jgi:uncharacterized protein YrzB (UPF0473 family)
MSEHELNDAVVELTAPDGQVFRFRYGATIPYAGQEYVVLLEMEDDANGEEQILITRVEEMEDGQLSFVVAEEEDVIQQVFDKYVAMTIHQAVDGLQDCDCGHDHCHGNGCSCHHEE